MAAPQIKNLDKLLENFLGKDAKIVDFSTKYLTAKGDNYGSAMLALDVTVKQNGSTKVLNAIAKCIPEDEFWREVFNVQMTSTKELSMYTDVAPALVGFQKERGIPEDKFLDVFPTFYGGRLNLNNSKVVDEDAVLVLENVKSVGYANGNRLEGFGLDDTKMILRNLARFHAVPVALKILNPEKFKSAVLPSLEQPKMGVNDDIMKNQENYSRQIKEHFSTFEDLRPYAEKAAEYIYNAPTFTLNVLETKTPLATMVHNDFWVNNMLLLKKDKSNEKSTNLKIVDYQVTIFGSLVHDILFFFFTSVELNLLQENFDALFEYYRKHFVECLQEFNLDVGPFSKEAFDEELKQFAIEEFGHIYMILWGVLTDKEKLEKMEPGANAISLDYVAPIFFTRAVYIFREYLKRGWFK